MPSDSWNLIPLSYNFMLGWQPLVPGIFPPKLFPLSCDIFRNLGATTVYSYPCVPFTSSFCLFPYLLQVIIYCWIWEYFCFSSLYISCSSLSKLYSQHLKVLSFTSLTVTVPTTIDTLFRIVLVHINKTHIISLKDDF